jgi:hypothetical protein
VTGGAHRKPDRASFASRRLQAEAYEQGYRQANGNTYIPAYNPYLLDEEEPMYNKGGGTFNRPSTFSMYPGSDPEGDE